MKIDRSKLTPVMQQYMDIKDSHPDSIIFFRLGDFYEMFFQDAVIVSRELELTLTSRNKKSDNPIPMAGIPYHSSQNYINRLIKKGFKVTICEQVGEAGGKDIVKREVVRTITPGTVLEDDAMSSKSNNYICAVYLTDFAFIVYCDISTGEFNYTRVNLIEYMSEIFKINPAELLIVKNNIPERDRNFFNTKFYITNIKEITKNDRTSIFSEVNDKDGILICNTLLEYIESTQKRNIETFKGVNIYSIDSYLHIDISAQKNLELISSLNNNNEKATLFGVIDFTRTSMGGRKLRRWILNPLNDVVKIKKRQKYINTIFKSSIIRNDLKEKLNRIRDIERIVNRVSYSSNNPRDIISLRESLNSIIDLKINKGDYSDISNIIMDLPDFEYLRDYLDNAIIDDPPVKITDGNFIKKGFDEQLDELKDISSDSKKWLISLEQQEREKTGIKNLRVKYNKIFGYFIEVSKGNIDKVPDSYIRKQTMTNSERFFTPELKEKESFILGSKERMLSLEIELWRNIREKVLNNYSDLMKASEIIAELDCFYSLAEVAYKFDYCMPLIDSEEYIEIRDGRHPVVERMIDEDFIPNDCIFDRKDGYFYILTGPNMAGKSTYIRQVAIITLMAQIGSFVPASYAKIGVVNKIFTRIGASDNLSMGKSTFMVEMTETADILKGADSNSLVILDEIGRGTSTYDGLSIAWAITEYLSNVGCFTLFATHYHELTGIQKRIEGIKNLNVAIIEEGDELIFLHKIISGAADRSYGIHVAELAGVPEEVINKARTILNSIENENSENSSESEDDNERSYINSRLIQTNKIEKQLNLFENQKKNEEYIKYGEVIAIIDEIKKLDINNLTPLKALNKLNQIKKRSQNL